MDTIKGFADTCLIFFAQIRHGMRIDWTIPATWIVGLAAAMLINLCVMLIWGTKLVASIDAMIVAQARIEGRVDKQEAKQSEVDSRLGIQQQTESFLKDRLDFLLRRIERLEQDAMRPAPARSK